MSNLFKNLRRILGVAAAVAVSATLFSPQAGAWTLDPYAWDTVAVGGGGNCPQLVIHPKVKDVMYLVADVGGLDRWDPVNSKWIPTLNWMRYSPDNNNEACVSAAVDPSDATGNTVWAAVGLYDWTPGEVMKSTDRGSTWIRNSQGLFKYCSNASQGYNQRLAVDPANANVVYAADNSGLSRTTDGGVTWTKLTSAPTGDITKLGQGSGLSGDLTVIIDPTSGTLTSPTRTKRVFLSPLGSAMYKTEDGGTTWSVTTGSPTNVRNGVFNTSGALYCAVDGGTTSGGVYKYTGGASGTWSRISPTTAGYSVVAIDPFNNNNVLAAEDTGWQYNIWHSTDGGATWPTKEVTASDNVTYNPAWYYSNWFAGFTSGLEYDPFRQGTVWENDIFAAYKTTNISAGTVVAWTTQIAHHEEVDVSCDLLSPPSGPTLLYSGEADVQGFAHTSLTASPSLITIGYVSGGQGDLLIGADYEEANPNFVAFDGTQGWSGTGSGGYTTDGGVTFHDFATNPANQFGGRIAVSANSQTIVWAISSSNPPTPYAPVYSTDLGATWHTCTGAPGLGFGYNVFNWNSPLCSDRKNGTKFYIYNNNGTFYRSTDTGHTFTQVASGLPALDWSIAANLIANPYVEGDLWLSLNANGLYHSTDSGTTWTKLANVQNAYMVTVGKGPNATTASIYTMGFVDSDTNEGVFRSDNLGASWFKIDVAQPYPGRGPTFMCGDRRTYGTVYVGTNIGIYYGQRGGGGAPPTPTGLTAAAGNAQVSLSWNASSGATSYNVKRSTVSGSGYATVASPTTTSYTNTGLTNGSTYYYVVSAVNASGESANSPQVSATPSAPVQAQIIAGTATIDGVAEAAWNAATAYTLTKTTGTISGASDCSATWKGLWDATNLYILVSVTDDVKMNDSTNPWDDDAVEIYLDADHNGGTAYDANDRQIVCGWGDAAAVEGGGRAIAGVAFGKTDPTGTTYIIEAKIPWSVEAFTPAANAIIGIDVHVDDDDDGGARDGKVIWNDGTDQAWTNPSLFGTGKLNASGVPPAPTGLTATPGNAQVGLSWTASSGATSYNVLRSTVSGSGYASVATGVTTTSYTNTGLTNGTTYYFVVTATNSSGTSGNSNQASATPTASTSTAFITGQTLGTIRNDFTGFVGFKFTVGATAITATDLGRWVVSGNTGSHTVKLVLASTGVDVSGGSVTVNTSGKPAGAYAYTTLTTGITLSANTAYYLLTQETTSGDQWYQDNTTLTPSSAGTVNQSEYYNAGYLIGTSGSVGFGPPNFKYTGGGSAPPAPAGLTATAGNTQVTLSWTASSGATSYNVYRGTAAGGESTTAIATGIATTTYTNTGLTNGTTYYFKVNAVNASGTSGYSNEASAKPVAPSTPFITGQTLGTIRNDFAGWVGFQFTVGAAAITVTDVGRWVVSGNTGSHVVKLVLASNGADVSGGSATVNTSGKPAGAYAYTTLTAPVTLTANTAYYVLTQETVSGDQWYQDNTTITAKAGATVNNSEYYDTAYHSGNGIGAFSYGPPNFKF